MSQIKVGCLTLGMLGNNTYFLHKDGEYDCIIIDPARDGEMLVTKLREKGLTIKAIFLTHAHFDHILGVPGIKKLCDVPIYGGKDDVEGFLDPSPQLGLQGVPILFTYSSVCQAPGCVRSLQELF